MAKCKNEARADQQNASDDAGRPSRARAGNRLPSGRFAPGSSAKPASGKAASGIPAKGPGYGGEARGRLAPSIGGGFQPSPAAISAGLANAAALREYLKPHTKTAADTWVKILENPHANEFAKAGVAEKIMERVVGKPKDVDPAPPPPRVRINVTVLTPKKQRELLDILRTPGLLEPVESQPIMDIDGVADGPRG